MAGYFTADGCDNGASVESVYLKIKGKEYIEIFPTSYDANCPCDLLGSPSEKGTIQYDNKVVKPTVIQFTGIVKIEYNTLIERIQEHLRKDRKVADLMCTVYTKGAIYDKMIIKSIKERGDQNRYDAIEISVELEEYLEHN